MFSLLVLAIVTGVYFTSVLTDTRVSKLQVVAALKSSQLQQSMVSYYFQVYSLSEKQELQQALTMRKAGNTSSNSLTTVRQTMRQFLEVSSFLTAARLYDLDFELISNVTDPEAQHNVSSYDIEDLFILEYNTSSSGPSLPNGLLENRGYLEGPVLVDDYYYMSITLPVYSNESILVPEQFLSGYLTVVVDLQSMNSSIGSEKNTEYSSINFIAPTHTYNNLTNYTGFYYAFENEYLEEAGVTSDSVFNISSFKPAQDVFLEGDQVGNYVNLKNPLGMKVSLGFSAVDFGMALWLVTVEQIQSDFESPITKLIKIMVGLCIGLAAIMCLITFPLAHYGVRPILKLQKATEEITDRKGLKRKKRKGKHHNPFQNLLMRVRDDEKVDDNLSAGRNTNKINQNETHNNDNHNNSARSTGVNVPQSSILSSSIRNSWNESLIGSSSVDSFSHSFAQASSDNTSNNYTQLNEPLISLVHTKGIFFDELTELTEAFNAMAIELDRQYSHLEDRVHSRTKELEAAKVQADAARQQAEKANEAKTVFIANISHELRTPLNGILGMTSVAMGEKDIDKIQSSLELIFRSGELLLHILIQLLTFSKNQLDKSKLQKKNFQVIEVASQINSIFGKTAKDQDVNLVITLKPNLIRKLILYGDSNRIIQVVMNLVSNSLKFTPENGTVRVLIQVLGVYDEKRSKESNYEKVFIEGLEKDAEYYPVKPVNDSQLDLSEENKHSSSDSSSFISTKTSSTLSTLRSSVYIKSLSSLYKSPNCREEYFNDDQFFQNSEKSQVDSAHKSRKCYNFGGLNKDEKTLNDSEKGSKSWVLRFSVTDTGTGIEKSLRDKIFEAFVQGDQTLSRSHGGTGLGLSICKQFAKMMSGTLTLDSTIGKGSTFTFTIPLPQVGEIILDDDELEEISKDDFNEKYNKRKRVTFIDDDAMDSTSSGDSGKDPKNGKKLDLANSYKSTITKDEKLKYKSSTDNLNPNSKNYDKPELITRASTGTAHSYRSKRSDASSVDHLSLEHISSNVSDIKLLVAEDNLVNQEVVKRMLKLEGVSNISMARDGKDAVEFVRESINKHSKPFDLILMDVQMPNMDGLSATKIIRHELGYTGPIVALTAFADISNEKGCLDAGMSGFLSKPIRRNLLRSTIKQFCSNMMSPLETEETEQN